MVLSFNGSVHIFKTQGTGTVLSMTSSYSFPSSEMEASWCCICKLKMSDVHIIQYIQWWKAEYQWTYSKSRKELFALHSMTVFVWSIQKKTCATAKNLPIDEKTDTALTYANTFIKFDCLSKIVPTTQSPSRRFMPSSSMMTEVCMVVSWLSSSLFPFGDSRHQVTTKPKELLTIWPSNKHFKKTPVLNCSATIRGNEGNGGCFSAEKELCHYGSHGL